MALSGFNGYNETKIGFSSSIELNFYNSSGNLINVRNLAETLNIWILRDPAVHNIQKESINKSNQVAKEYEKIYFDQVMVNASICFNIYPKSNKNISYLVLFNQFTDGKLDPNKFSLGKVLCSPGTRGKLSFWIDKDYLNGYKGLVAFRIRELIEYGGVCPSDNILSNENPAAVKKTKFTEDFDYHVFSVGCFYLNSAFMWVSDGMDVVNDSNTKYTHCKSNRAGNFAGGYAEGTTSEPFVIFDETKNPTIILSICAIFIISFILLTLFGIYNDKNDLEKIGITYLDDNEVDDTFKYKITIFTGTQSSSQTDSNVILVIYGDKDEIKARPLFDSSRRLFRRGGIDCFILTTKKLIGTIDYIKIWHDNSGRGDSASWYLNYLIVQDLQTNQKFYFICKKWLAVEKDDHKIERILIPVGSIKKTEILYLIKEETKNCFSDGHLFLSIFFKPTLSKFSRVERVFCSYVNFFNLFGCNIIYAEFSHVIDYSKKSLFMIGDFNVFIENVSYLLDFLCFKCSL